MVKKEKEKLPSGPVCSNCGGVMKEKAGGILVCPDCGNEERAD